MFSRVAALLLGLGFSFLISTPAQALYLRPDLEQVPIDKLLATLTRLAADKPKESRLQYNLARTYGMAYASKMDMCSIWKGKEQQGAWFGYEPPFVPFNKVTDTKDPEKLKSARAYLDKAIASYETVIKLDPNFLPAQLGLAWCTEQKGDRKAAIAAYRKVIENGWKTEKNLQAGPLGGHYITTEASRYLIPLLDKDKDKAEITELQDRMMKLARLPRPVTPLAVPLRDGLTARDLEALSAKVAFDVDGSGLVQHWTWITRDAAWLVHDPHHTGKVTSALQMFGNVSFWLFWENGYQPLQVLDENQDGQLTGKELEGLALWHDANGNGRSDPGEVKPLAAHGIVAISCKAQRDPAHPDNLWFSPRGVTFANGRTRPTFDLVLKSR